MGGFLGCLCQFADWFLGVAFCRYLGNYGFSSNQFVMNTFCDTPGWDAEFCESIGWDVESATDENQVTIVKRAIVFSEVTIPKSEFIKCQKMFDKDWDNAREHFQNNIESKMETDDVMEDFGNEYTKFAVFEGDISSMTDDVMGMCEFKWEHFVGNETKIQEVKFAF
tara:strand:+ start:58 stop:558 length:501 start_codon:yes stop_codon:yes gene_type:complete